VTEPRTEEINRVIAEFMGSIPKQVEPFPDYVYKHCKGYAYCTSLDSLIPVVEKIGERVSFVIYTETKLTVPNIDRVYRIEACDELLSHTYPMVEDLSMSHGLALAIYHVLREREL